MIVNCNECDLSFPFVVMSAGVDFSKTLGQTKIVGGQKVAITDESMGVSQLLGSMGLGYPPPKSMPMIISNKYILY